MNDDMRPVQLAKSPVPPYYHLAPAYRMVCEAACPPLPITHKGVWGKAPLLPSSCVAVQGCALPIPLWGKASSYPHYCITIFLPPSVCEAVRTATLYPLWVAYHLRWYAVMGYVCSTKGAVVMQSREYSKDTARRKKQYID